MREVGSRPWESALTRQVRGELVIGWVDIFREVVVGSSEPVGSLCLELQVWARRHK